MNSQSIISKSRKVSSGAELRSLSDERVGYNLTPARIVGMAFLVLGALKAAGGVLALIFADSLKGPFLVDGLTSLALATALCMAGLWIMDGQRKGAILGVVVSALSLLVALFFAKLSGQFGVLNFIIQIALLVGAVFVLPDSERTAPKMS